MTVRIDLTFERHISGFPTGIQSEVEFDAPPTSKGEGTLVPRLESDLNDPHVPKA